MTQLLHIVTFSINGGLRRDDLRVAEAAALSRDHPQHISEILGWWCGFDTSTRADAWDFACVGQFASAETLERFHRHPHHQAGARAWRRLATWKVVDLEIEVGQSEASPLTNLVEG